LPYCQDVRNTRTLNMTDRWRNSSSDWLNNNVRASGCSVTGVISFLRTHISLIPVRQYRDIFCKRIHKKNSLPALSCWSCLGEKEALSHKIK